MRNRCVQHMQKVLVQMNVKLDSALSSIAWAAGMAVMDTIIAGERDEELAASHARAVRGGSHPSPRHQIRVCSRHPVGVRGQLCGVSHIVELLQLAGARGPISPAASVSGTDGRAASDQGEHPSAGTNHLFDGRSRHRVPRKRSRGWEAKHLEKKLDLLQRQAERLGMRLVERDGSGSIPIQAVA